MDTFAFASLAHFRILLVPVGDIPRVTFERLAAEIRTFDSIRLGDIPSDAKDDRARFMPNPLSTGHLLLSFPTHPPPISHHPLSLFRPSHFPLAVIGIAVSSRSESLPPIHAQFSESLIDFFTPGSVFPLAKNCFVYDESDEGGLNFTGNLPGLVIIPNAMGNKKLYVGTLLADLCSNVLREFAEVAHILESPVGNEYLNAALFPSLPSHSELPNRVGVLNSTLTSHHSHSEISRTSVILSAAPLGKRSSAGSSFRQSTLAVSAQKKRMSTLGVASSHGRLFKTLGDLFLLAGRVEDASIWYTEAIQLFKNTQDFAWHACTLEGMATVAVVEAWVTGHGLVCHVHSLLRQKADPNHQQSSLSSKEPWSDISEKLSQASNLYQKSAITEGEQTYTLLSFMYTSCVLRHAFLFFSIWSAKGWGPLSFTTMLQSGPASCLPPTLSYEDSTQWSSLERLSSLSGISRSFISSIVAQAHGPWLLHLAPRERINVLEVMASLYACLGYKRKEIYILREVVGCIMDLVVCGREEDGMSRPMNVPSANGLNLVPPAPVPGDGAVGVRFNDSKEGNDSILRLLVHICQVLGVDLEAVKMVDASEEAAQNWSNADELESDLDHAECYGWSELQLGVVREAVAVAEALPDFPSVARFSASALKGLRRILTPADQIHLYTTCTRALSVARRRGDTRSIEYWSERPIMNIVIAPLPLIRVPIERPTSALQARISDFSPILSGATQSFLYNPRKAAAARDTKVLVVQNDPIEFIVTLQNPFIFDLEIQSISLSTAGIPFTSQPSKATIAGNSIHEIAISGVPLETGLLIVRGCFVRAVGGAMREFKLPLLTDKEEQKLSRRRSAHARASDRYKYSGLECFLQGRKGTTGLPDAAKPISTCFLECQVIPEQPLLRIRRTSVTHGAVMLYEGEKSPIRITIENVSHLPIDFIRLIFDDSTMGPAQKALAEGELSVFDTYETEYSLLHRPVLSWNKEEGTLLLPGESYPLTIQCYGKAGCTKAIVHISYANAHRVEAETMNVFHTRQLSFSMMVTVYQMLECHAMDLVPFPSYPATRIDVSAKDAVLWVEQPGWCLFSVDIRNTYGSPFEVTLERVQEGVESTTTTATIPPGSTYKLCIPLKKFSLPPDIVSEPIPTLSDRQFVVSKSNLSDSEEKLQRKLFWYREELLKIIRGHWRESGGTRYGDLSLRKQRMTLSMLDTIKMEPVHVQLYLTDANAESLNEGFQPKPYTFVCLKAVVKNLCSSSGVFVMNLRLEPNEHVIYDGINQNIPVGRLEPGESQEVNTTICFLSCGYFDISAEVRQMNGDQTVVAGVGFLQVNIPQELPGREGLSQKKGIV